MSDIIIKGGHLVLPENIVEGDILLEGDRIVEIGPMLERKDAEVFNAKGLYVLPGFIDIHNHGASGFDLSFGKFDATENRFTKNKADFMGGLKEALRFYVSHGITTLLPTTIAAPLEDLEQSLQYLREYQENKNPFWQIVYGVNIEGTFLKMPAYAGAQNPAFFYEASVENFDRLQKACDGLIRIVNVPPEHGEAGIHLIRHLKKQNVRVACGHSGCYADQFNLAVAEGLNLGVHFMNGPSRSSHKPFHGGGAIEAMLRADEVTLEMIVDGYHVMPAYFRDTLERKGADKMIAITDSMFAAGLKGLDTFELSGLQGRVSSNNQYLHLVGKHDGLFGSVLKSDQGFENVLNWLTQKMTGIWHREHSAYPLEQALVVTSKLYSANPANFLGIANEEGGRGSLKAGNLADLLVLSISEKNGTYKTSMQHVFLKGEKVF